MLLQAFYSIRSERQLMERLEFDLLFRWFVGLSADEPASRSLDVLKNRDRLFDGEIAAKFLAAVLAQPRVKRHVQSAFRRRRHTDPGGPPCPSARDTNETDLPTDDAGGRRNATVDFKGGARTRRTARRPTRKRCSIARVPAWRRSSASSATG